MFASRSLTLDFAAAVADACDLKLAPKKDAVPAGRKIAEVPPPGASARQSGKGAHVSPENRARYDAAITEWKAGDETLVIVAQRHGIPLSTINNYLVRERAAHRRAQAAARAPQLKPGGQIL
jgi:hypothetical protein